MKNLETTNETQLIEHALLNQISKDITDEYLGDYSYMIQQLIKSPKNIEIILNYLSDKEKEDLIEGNTKTYY